MDLISYSSFQIIDKISLLQGNHESVEVFTSEIKERKNEITKDVIKLKWNDLFRKKIGVLHNEDSTDFLYTNYFMVKKTGKYLSNIFPQFCTLILNDNKRERISRSVFVDLLEEEKNEKKIVI